MNAMMVLMTVIIIAPTLMEALNVAVIMAIDLIAMVVLALVSILQNNIPDTTLLLSDINECDEGIDDCDHNCTNTEGSFDCSCMNGYKLDSDQSNCTGKYSITCAFIGVIVYPNQISMNVTKLLMTVITIALTLREALNVHVLLAINSIATVVHA